MPRWKIAAEISQDRYMRFIIALYGDDKMPIQRLFTEFHESDSRDGVAEALEELAKKIREFPS